jgi:hypothetical protein
MAMRRVAALGIACVVATGVAGTLTAGPAASQTARTETTSSVVVTPIGVPHRTLRIYNATPDLVSLAGGQTQVLTIRPADVTENRTYGADRGMTVLRAGAFSLYAMLDDQTGTS